MHYVTCSPQAVTMTKQLVAEAVEAPDSRAFRERIVAEAAGRRHSPEAAEGLASFAEKRRPAWYPAK
jgi:methylglutaconyl-CoA hydratase